MTQRQRPHPPGDHPARRSQPRRRSRLPNADPLEPRCPRSTPVDNGVMIGARSSVLAGRGWVGDPGRSWAESIPPSPSTTWDVAANAGPGIPGAIAGGWCSTGTREGRAPSSEPVRSPSACGPSFGQRTVKRSRVKAARGTPNGSRCPDCRETVWVGRPTRPWSPAGDRHLGCARHGRCHGPGLSRWCTSETPPTTTSQPPPRLRRPRWVAVAHMSRQKVKPGPRTRVAGKGLAVGRLLGGRLRMELRFRTWGSSRVRHAHWHGVLGPLRSTLNRVPTMPLASS